MWTASKPSKAPVPSLYGGNPLSGTINLVRKRPDPASNFARVNASLGSFSTYRATLDASRALSDQGHALRLNALWQEAEGYRDDKNSSILAVNPTLRLNLGESSTLHLDFEYLTSEHQSDSGLPIVGGALPDVPRTRSYQSPFDLSEQTILRLRADYEWHLAPNFTLRDKLYYTSLDWPSQGTLFNGAFPNAAGSLDLARTLLDLDDQQRIVGNQLEGLLRLQTGGIEHQLLFGVEIANLTDDFTLDVALLSFVDLFTLDATLPPSLAPFMPAEAEPDSLVFPLDDQATAAQAAAQTLAPYFVDRIIVSPHFELLLGGRFDRIDYEDDLSATKRDYRQLSRCSARSSPPPRPFRSTPIRAAPLPRLPRKSLATATPRKAPNTKSGPKPRCSTAISTPTLPSSTSPKSTSPSPTTTESPSSSATSALGV